MMCDVVCVAAQSDVVQESVCSAEEACLMTAGAGIGLQTPLAKCFSSLIRNKSSKYQNTAWQRFGVTGSHDVEAIKNV